MESLPRFAFDRVKAGLPMAGIFIVTQDIPVGSVIEDLVLLIECSEQEEWEDRVIYFPL